MDLKDLRKLPIFKAGMLFIFLIVMVPTHLLIYRNLGYTSYSYIIGSITGWIVIITAASFLFFLVSGLISSWHKFSKSLSFALLFIGMLLLVPFPNFHESCVCTDMIGGECSCSPDLNFVNGLMLFVDFGSLRVTNHLDYYDTDLSFFVTAILFSSVLTLIMNTVYFRYLRKN
jgi:hypothetical protein